MDNARVRVSNVCLPAAVAVPSSYLRASSYRRACSGARERERDLPLNKEGERPKGCTTTRPIPNPLTLCHSSASLCYGSTIAIKNLQRILPLSPTLGISDVGHDTRVANCEVGKGLCAKSENIPRLHRCGGGRNLEREKFLTEREHIHKQD